MDYKFYVSDFDRIKDHKATYPKAGRIFDYPTSFWFGVRKGKKKYNNLYNRVDRLLTRAHPGVPVMVMYNLPDRDLGSHSKGGACSDDDYYNFVRQFAQAIGKRSPIVILEPDAIPHSTLMETAAQQHRLTLLRTAIQILLNESESIVYVDVGHSNWLSATDAAMLINRVHVDGLRGFSVNVSNFRSTAESMDWSLRVAEQAQAKHFVIDTSRNGNGPYGNDWCNPPDRALGTPATTDTGNELCDAFLWIKVPGESDGKCNGGPRAGRFWIEYARELVQNTAWIN